MKPNNKAYIYASLVVLAWATVASAFKLSLRYLTVIELLLFSSLVSAITLLLILVIQKKIYLLKTFNKKDFLFSALLGFLNPFLYYLILLKAYTLLPAQQAQPLNMIWGIVLVMISIPLLKQKPRAVDFIALLICFAGVIVISTKGDITGLKISSPLGVGLALSSSIIWSFYWILNVRDKKDPLIRLFLNFVMGTGFVFIVYIFQPRIPPIAGIIGAVYVGLFEMGLTFFWWLMALKLSKATVNVAILIYLVPFFSFVFIHFLLGETILFSSILGAGLIVIGTLINKYHEFRSHNVVSDKG
jgi:drug/metabolite transporter (DMT)-like permease